MNSITRFTTRIKTPALDYAVRRTVRRGLDDCHYNQTLIDNHKRTHQVY